MRLRMGNCSLIQLFQRSTCKSFFKSIDLGQSTKQVLRWQCLELALLSVTIAPCVALRLNSVFSLVLIRNLESKEECEKSGVNAKFFIQSLDNT